MKQITEVEQRVAQQVASRWADEVTAEITGGEQWWPRRYALGRPDAHDLGAGFATLIDLIDAWRQWAAVQGAQLAERNIRNGTASYPVPSHITIPDLATAARIAGSEWTEQVDRGREVAGIVAAQFPHRLDALAPTVRATVGWTDVDIQLLCRAARWFEFNPTAGLSPREVPLEGFHTKWLETRKAAVSRLAGLTDLGLLPRHPARVHFSYLDPAHMAAGRRRHDSATVGDSFWPAYTPDLVIICENKDTAIHFPATPRAISVEGAGSGAAAFAAFPWIRQAPLVIYWGDMDADGLRILSQFRAAGINAQSLFMDVPAYEKWARFGTNIDKRGNPIVAEPGAAVPGELEPHEQELWAVLAAPAATDPRRIEQERIPLADAATAAAAVRNTVSQSLSGAKEG